MADFSKFFFITNWSVFGKSVTLAKYAIWEALKAYMCGQIISYTAYKNKKCNAQLVELTQQISNLDSQ